MPQGTPLVGWGADPHPNIPSALGFQSQLSPPPHITATSPVSQPELQVHHEAPLPPAMAQPALSSWAPLCPDLNHLLDSLCSLRPALSSVQILPLSQDPDSTFVRPSLAPWARTSFSELLLHFRARLWRVVCLWRGLHHLRCFQRDAPGLWCSNMPSDRPGCPSAATDRLWDHLSLSFPICQTEAVMVPNGACCTGLACRISELLRDSMERWTCDLSCLTPSTHR